MTTNTRTKALTRAATDLAAILLEYGNQAEEIEALNKALSSRYDEVVELRRQLRNTKVETYTANIYPIDQSEKVARYNYSTGNDEEVERGPITIEVPVNRGRDTYSYDRPIDLSGMDMRTWAGDLSRRDLSSFNLSFTNLEGANLSGSDLQATNLNYACLADADLRGADLRSACCYGTSFERADLTGAKLDFTQHYLMYWVLRNAIKNLHPRELRYQMERWIGPILAHTDWCWDNFRRGTLADTPAQVWNTGMDILWPYAKVAEVHGNISDLAYRMINAIKPEGSTDGGDEDSYRITRWPTRSSRDKEAAKAEEASSFPKASTTVIVEAPEGMSVEEATEWMAQQETARIRASREQEDEVEAPY